MFDNDYLKHRILLDQRTEEADRQSLLKQALNGKGAERKKLRALARFGDLLINVGQRIKEYDRAAVHRVPMASNLRLD